MQDSDNCSEYEYIVWQGWVQEGGRKAVTAPRREGSRGSMQGAVPVLSPSPKGEPSTHQRQVPPCTKGRWSPLEMRMHSGVYARGSSRTWLCWNQPLLVGQTDPVMGSGNLVFWILHKTSFYHASTALPHRPCAEEHTATPVSHPSTVRAKRGVCGGFIFSFSPSCSALKTDECTLQANEKFLATFD